MEEILESIKPEKCANPMIRAYVKLKLQIDLRRTDLLGLTKRELKTVIDDCNGIKPLSLYLFKTRKGDPHLKPTKTVEGFASI